MSLSRLLPLAVTMLSLAAGPIDAADPSKADPGEFYIVEVFPLNSRQIEHLRTLIRDDREAAMIAREIEAAAERLQEIEPTPLRTIEYEGLVNSDPRRMKTVASLRQMADVAVLFRHWQATGDAKTVSTLEHIIDAWASTYQPTGNDVNENKLYPLLIAYEALRGEFADERRNAVDDWVVRLGELHADAVSDSTHYTNRYSKHLRLLALAGMILDRDDWTAQARDGVKRFVRKSLRADGTSLDLEWRDSLGYHGSALRPPLQLAMLSGDSGRELYQWQSPEGGSLEKSVEYLVPYALGEKIHREWVDTKVGLDRQRAAAGIEKYQIGKPYDPQSALKVMERASFFDPELLRVVRHLSKSDRSRFPTWTTLVNTAAASTSDTSIDLRATYIAQGFSTEKISLPDADDTFPAEGLRQVSFEPVARFDWFPEGPSYRPTDDRYFFSGKHALTRIDAAGELHRVLGEPGGGGTHHLPDGSVLIVGHVGLRRLHPDGRVELLADVEQTGAGNDLTVGRHGEIYFSVPKSGIYRLTAGEAGRLEKVSDHGCNGLEVDLAGGFLYVVRGGVERYPIDIESDSLGRPETIYKFPKGQGGGDGCTFDAFGNLYTMHFRTGTIRVIDPASRSLLAEIPVGVVPATNLTFGGPENSDLLVTAGTPKHDNCQVLKAKLGVVGFCGHVGSTAYPVLRTLEERGDWSRKLERRRPIRE